MIKKMPFIKKNKTANGQIALIVLLIMVIILTIGLSLASRSLIDIKISQDEKEALRSFSAAEAGIESILKTNLAEGTTSIDISDDLTAYVTVVCSGEGMTQTVEAGANFNVYLEGSDANNLTISWIDETKTDEMNNPASLELIIYDENANITYSGYNAIERNNGYLTISTDPSNSFYREITISINSNDDKLVRINPLYNRATIMVTSDSGDLTDQLCEITSKVTDVNKTSAIEVNRTAAVLPSIFDYVLFSGGGNLSP